VPEPLGNRPAEQILESEQTNLAQSRAVLGPLWDVAESFFKFELHRNATARLAKGGRSYARRSRLLRRLRRRLLS